jgi:hypothetical protein
MSEPKYNTDILESDIYEAMIKGGVINEFGKINKEYFPFRCVEVRSLNDLQYCTHIQFDILVDVIYEKICDFVENINQKQLTEDELHAFLYF